MSRRVTRRGFLVRGLLAAGAAGLVVLGFAGRAARRTARTFRIPWKPLDRSKLRDPHDLAG